MTVADITFTPLLPWALIALMSAVAALLLGYGWVRRVSGSGLRTIAIAAALIALANPSLIEERREPLKDVAAVIVDRSPSQNIQDRRAAADAALEALQTRLQALNGLEVRVVEAGSRQPGRGLDDDQGTELFGAAREALADVPANRVAGTIFITDGQIHDSAGDVPGPVHGLISGRREVGDRRLVVRKAPAYGMVDGRLTLVLRIEDSGAEPGSTARVSIRRDSHPPEQYDLGIGRDENIPLVLDHAGLSVVEIEAAAGPEELTLRNNRAAIVINGVRDRLRVLLVSGEPHAGERTWRNLLKADPSVDLVHFTILRPPEKQDGTPVRELSLIAFPIFELFEMRLDEFDLVIFDRYRRRGVLPPAYFLNIAKYVENGGALLAASGPEFASPLSIHRSALGDVLPGAPSGTVLERGFKPILTDIGRRHPVTNDLDGAGSDKKTPDWGRWFRLIDAKAERGVEAMAGPEGKPLLLLDRFGEGRVAQLLSDHAWLWTRGFEGGGPQAELLRRLAHWLMKEPELEEEDLRTVVTGGRLQITRRSLDSKAANVSVTSPSGATTEVQLEAGENGLAQGGVDAAEIGVYRTTDGARSAIAVSGALNPKEFADVRATGEIIAPVAEATDGGVFWLADGPSRRAGLPDIRRVKPGRDASGRNWLGLRANGSYTVTGVDRVPLMPALLAMLLILGGLITAWWREGK